MATQSNLSDEMSALGSQVAAPNLEAIAALKRLSGRMRGLYKEGMTGEEMRDAVNEQVDKLIVKAGGKPLNQTLVGIVGKELYEKYGLRLTPEQQDQLNDLQPSDVPSQDKGHSKAHK